MLIKLIRPTTSELSSELHHVRAAKLGDSGVGTPAAGTRAVEGSDHRLTSPPPPRVLL